MMNTKEQMAKLIEAQIDSITALSIECIETIYNAAYNAAIEDAAKWLETANRNGTDDAKEVRRLKK